MEENRNDNLLSQMMDAPESVKEEKQEEAEATVVVEEKQEAVPAKEDAPAEKPAEPAEEKKAEAKEEDKPVEPAKDAKPEAEEAKTQEQDPAPTPAQANPRRQRRNDRRPAQHVANMNFFETAESVLESNLGSLNERKRRMADRNRTLSEEDLVYAVAESVETYADSQGNESPMLKLRTLENGAPIYVSQRVAGANYNNMDVMVGHRFAVAIVNFEDVTSQDQLEAGGDHSYIVSGSIQQAEFIIKGRLYAQLNDDNESVRREAMEEKREGVVTGLARLTNRDNGSERWVVYFEYRGCQFSIPAERYTYLSLTKSVPEQIHIGERFAFSITRAFRNKYEDNPRVKRLLADEHTKYTVPTGYYYDINVSALRFRPSLRQALQSKLDHNSAFVARVVAYNEVRGLIVEVAPGWTIKAYIPNRFTYVHLGDKDVAYHTPVTVRLTSIDFDARRGRCEVVGFPEGTKGSSF